MCLKNIVPFKEYPEAYPYNQQKNIDFVKAMEARGINMQYWINGFKKEYKPALTDMLENTERMIANHVAEVIEEYRTLGLEVKENEIFEKLEEIKDNPNQSTVIDIKNHLKQIKSLQGQNFYVHSIKKVIIYIETNPLKVLQMGNVVSGSCLALGGSNSWTTITNAVDVNKRVLYAENEKGIILGRRMITMTNEGKIIQYGVYNNAPQIDIDNLFQRFTLELAQKMNTTVADMGDTSTLIGENWYAGTPIQAFSLHMAHPQQAFAQK